jgi:NADH-ubiquinone oxidoreductase chain 5
MLIFLSGLAGISVLLFGRKTGERGASYIIVGGTIISWLWSVEMFCRVILEKEVVLLEGPKWITRMVEWTFLFDSLSVLMLVVILSISLLVQIYSIEYMKGDPHVNRFLSYLSLFTFFMLILVTSNNFLQLFLGWEGVGLCSYLLINFWFTRKQANKSALKAMVVNRIGDVGLMLGFCFIYNLYQTLDFSVIFMLTPKLSETELIILGESYSYMNLISFFLLLGAAGKSAQLGLHLWLPDAMEGPTPVSALIHAATMVTAGVYLLVRCSVILEMSEDILVMVGYLGAITSIFAASTGLFQNDLKKVIAYSTCSQLGYMFLACGISAYDAAMFHLFTHAFFKALLFLGAGGVIHSIGDEQDLRKMGALLNLLPLTYISILIGSLSLMGIPYLSGFYSKEWILELSASRMDMAYLYMLGLVSTGLTGFYSIRLIYLAFISSAKNNFKTYEGVHEVGIKMGLSYVILIPSSIFIGYVFKDLLVGLGSSYWNNSIYIKYENFLSFDGEFLPYDIKLFPLFFGLMGGILGYIVPCGYSFLVKKWYLDELSNKMVKGILKEGYVGIFKGLDKGWFELLGPTGIVNLFSQLVKQMKEIQTGYIYHYLGLMSLAIFVGLTFVSLDVIDGILVVGWSIIWLRHC